MPESNLHHHRAVPVPPILGSMNLQTILQVAHSAQLSLDVDVARVYLFVLTIAGVRTDAFYTPVYSSCTQRTRTRGLIAKPLARERARVQKT